MRSLNSTWWSRTGLDGRKHATWGTPERPTVPHDASHCLWRNGGLDLRERQHTNRAYHPTCPTSIIPLCLRPDERVPRLRRTVEANQAYFRKLVESSQATLTETVKASEQPMETP
ncbi:hypothetical protein GCM10027563_06720 [Parasphingorhabdus pacifica]